MKLKFAVLVLTFFAVCVAGNKHDFYTYSDDIESTENEKYKELILAVKKKNKLSKHKKAIALGGALACLAGAATLLPFLSEPKVEPRQSIHILPSTKIDGIGATTIKLNDCCMDARMLDSDKVLTIAKCDQINICDIKTKNVTHILHAISKTHDVNAAISKDGKKIVIVSNNSCIEILNSNRGWSNQCPSIEKHEKLELMRHFAPRLSISHDGKFVAIIAAFIDYKIYSIIWDCESNVFFQIPFDDIHIKFNPQDSGIQAFTCLGNAWIMQRRDSFKPKQITIGQRICFHDLDFSPDGNHILALGGLSVFDIDLKNENNVVRTSELNELKGAGTIGQIDISPTGKRFLITLSEGLLLYDYHTFKCLYYFKFNGLFPCSSIATASFSSDGFKIIIQLTNKQDILILSDLVYENKMGNMLKYLRSAQASMIDNYLNRTIFEHVNTMPWQGSEDGNVMRCTIEVPR